MNSWPEGQELIFSAIQCSNSIASILLDLYRAHHIDDNTQAMIKLRDILANYAQLSELVRDINVDVRTIHRQDSFVKVNGVSVFQYDSDWLYSSDKQWAFQSEMIDDCAPLFDSVSSHHDLEVILKDIVGPDDSQDAESSCYYVYFKSRKNGMDFIKRLNKFLVDRATAIMSAYALPQIGK